MKPRVPRAYAGSLAALFTSLVPLIARAEPQSEPAAPPETAIPSAGAPTAAQVDAEQLPAQSPVVAGTSSERCKRDRCLRDHVFNYPALIDSALITTYGGIRARVGTQRFPDTPTVVGTANIYFTTAAETLDLGIKITDWLGVSATGFGRTLIGTNLSALTYGGLTFDHGLGGSAIVRLFRNDRTGSQLSVRAGASYSHAQIATLLPVLEAPAASVADALASDLGEAMRTPVSSVTYGGAVTFAQGFNPMFGLQAAAGIGGTNVTLEPYDRTRRVRDSTSASDVTFDLGIAPSVDFEPLGVPIAVMPEYLLSRTISSNQLLSTTRFDTAHTLALGVYYSDRPNLQLGIVGLIILGASGIQTPQGTSGTPDIYAGQLVLRYIW